MKLLHLILLNVVFLNVVLRFDSFAQRTDSIRAENLAKLGLQAESQSEFDQSFVYREKALKLFEKTKNWNRLFDMKLRLVELMITKGDYSKAVESINNGLRATSEFGLKDYKDAFHQKLGRSLLLLSRPYEAIDYFETSLNYRKDKYGIETINYAQALNGLAKAKLALGEYKEAFDYLEQGLEITESIGEAAEITKLSQLHSLSFFYRNVSLFNEMLKVNQEALELSLKHFGENHPKTAQSYYNFASSYTFLEQPAKCEQHNLKSIQIRERLFGKDHPSLASNYCMEATNYYYQQKLQKSIANAREAYRIGFLNFGDEHIKSVWAMMHIGKALNETGEPSKGLELAKKVLRIRKKMFKGDHPELAVGYRSLATAYNFLGDYVNAKKNYKVSIQIQKKNGTHKKSMAKSYMQLSQFNTRLGLFYEGIEDANSSFIANNSFISSVDGFDWPQVEGYKFFYDYYWAGAFKIYCLYSLADQYTDSSELYYKAALEGAHFLDSLVLHRLKQVTYSDDKFLSSANSHRAMELGFWSALYLYDKTKDPFYQKEMLYFNERSKANMLLIKSQSRNAKSFAGVPNDIIENQKHLLKTIERKKSEYLALISNDYSDDQQVYNIRSAIYEQENKLLELNTIIKNDYPRYHSLVHETKPVTLKSVQSFLSLKEQKSAIVEYLVTTGNVYYTIILDDSVKSFNVRYNQQTSMQSKVLAFRESVMNIEDTTFKKHSNHLYQLLIDSIRPILDHKKVKSLTVIPDGALFYLPFEILSAANYGDYLMESYDIGYANSITLLMKEKPINPTNNIISFAPEFSESLIASNDVVRGELAKLPGAQKEVNVLSGILNNEPYLKQEATETNFKENAGNYGIIHLATHAIVDEASPESAKLVFNIENDSINDGNLYPHEIYNLDLKAQLVTLSACNTGFGKIKKGEGVMSLSRAFAYAGVPATVVSLWPASDKSTPELMKYFYQNLKEGQTKDVALNNARKQYLSEASGKARHPFYWGGFVLIGDNSPVVKSSNSMIWLATFMIIIFGAGAYMRRQKKRTL